MLPLLAVLALAQQRPVDLPITPPPGPAEPLMSYSGEEVAMRYVPGALDRAVHVAMRLDLVIAELRSSLDVVFPLTAIVLGRDEWERRGLTRTYGLPQPLSVGSIAVPAAGDAGTVRKWKTWLGTELPDIGGVPLVGTADDASSLMLSDLVLQVEVCELIFDRTPMGAADPWIRGLFSHLAAISLWSTFEPRRMPEIESVWARMRDQIPPLLALEPRRQAVGRAAAGDGALAALRVPPLRRRVARLRGGRPQDLQEVAQDHDQGRQATDTRAGDRGLSVAHWLDRVAAPRSRYPLRRVCFSEEPPSASSTDSPSPP